MRRISLVQVFLFTAVGALAIGIVAAYVAQVSRSVVPSSGQVRKDEVRTFAPGEEEKQLRIAEMERTYRLYVPPGITTAKSYPLVILFHGAGGSAEQMRDMTQFNAIADTHKLIVAYGNGTTDAQRGEQPLVDGQIYSGQVWHSGRTFTPNIKTIDDIAYAKAIIQSVASQLPINKNRVFAAGFSNGGSLSYRLACEAGDNFRAVAAVGSALEVADCDGKTPVSLLAIQGTDDGSYNTEFRGFLEPKRQVSESNALVAKAFGCSSESLTREGAFPAFTYHSCREDVEIKELTAEGIGHTWTPAMSDVIWNFFQSRK